MALLGAKLTYSELIDIFLDDNHTTKDIIEQGYLRGDSDKNIVEQIVDTETSDILTDYVLILYDDFAYLGLEIIHEKNMDVGTIISFLSGDIVTMDETIFVNYPDRVMIYPIESKVDMHIGAYMDKDQLNTYLNSIHNMDPTKYTNIQELLADHPKRFNDVRISQTVGSATPYLVSMNITEYMRNNNIYLSLQKFVDLLMKYVNIIQKLTSKYPKVIFLRRT